VLPQLNDINIKGFSTPETRWAKLGPYYAMFPIDFAFNVVEKYSKPGQSIIDPFAGRGSSVFAAGALNRKGIGIEINPVGWVYGKTKIAPTTKTRVLDRLEYIFDRRLDFLNDLKALPLFFRHCYCDNVLSFLLSARRNLDWRNRKIDRTLMAFLLLYLHGKLKEGLSNQMRMSKALGPEYCMNWWKEKNMLTPPEINPYKFLKQRIEWRYKVGKPKMTSCDFILGDSTKEIRKIGQKITSEDEKFSLLFTSPPYWSVTNYYADQWLRFWLLGGPTHPSYGRSKYEGRFHSKEFYKEMLHSVFSQLAPYMADNSTIYVRTDSRKFTFNTTLQLLQDIFSDYTVKWIDQPFPEKTQTSILGNSSKSKGEIDIVLQRFK
jgi:DNA modification methylase